MAVVTFVLGLAVFVIPLLIGYRLGRNAVWRWLWVWAGSVLGFAGLWLTMVYTSGSVASGGSLFRLVSTSRFEFLVPFFIIFSALIGLCWVIDRPSAQMFTALAPAIFGVATFGLCLSVLPQMFAQVFGIQRQFIEQDWFIEQLFKLGPVGTIVLLFALAIAFATAALAVWRMVRGRNNAL